MANALIQTTCKTCGKTFYKEAVKKNWNEKKAWETWAATQSWDCEECYKAAKIEAAVATACENGKVPPAVWFEKVNGGKCNQKIYGGKQKSIYVNNNKIDITDTEAAELEAFWQD